MDINNARVWTIHQPPTTQDEGCRANIDKGLHHLGMEYQAIAGGSNSSANIKLTYDKQKDWKCVEQKGCTQFLQLIIHKLTIII